MALSHSDKSAALAAAGFARNRAGELYKASTNNAGWNWIASIITDTFTLVDQHGREQDTFPIEWARFQ